MRILIAGYYGFGNLGDEAVLAGILKQLPEGAEPTVLSFNPKATTTMHGVPAVPRLSPRHVLRALRECDLFLSGGGSLFQDATSFQSLLYYWSLIELARMCGKRIVIYAQGLGPLRRTMSRFLAATALHGAHAIAFRDEASAALARATGMGADASIVADPAFALVAPSRGSDVAPHVIVCLRDWQDWWTEAAERNLACRLDRLATCARVTFLAMHARDDGPIAQRMAARLLAPVEVVAPASVDAALQLIASSSFVLGMRLHALILSALCGVPALAVAYDPKVSAFAEAVGFPCVASPDELAMQLPFAWHRRAEMCARLESRRVVMSEREQGGRDFLSRALKI